LVKAIVIDELRIAYVPVAKAASSSIKTSIRKHLGLPRTWLYGQDAWPKLSDPHEIPRDVFTFTCVRNPRDRIASLWRNKTQRPDLIRHLGPEHERFWAGMSFDAFCEVLSEIDLDLNVHTRPMVNTLLPFRLDWTFRIDSIGENWWLTGLPNLPRANATEGKTKWSKRAKQIVGSLYREDFREYGYR
jgi:Sulfotransferase family